MTADVLLIGASGMLGRAMAAELRKRGRGFDAPPRAELDLSDPAKLERGMRVRPLPSLIINCAAWTDVDGAEAHPEEAYRLNAQGAWNVSEACRGWSIPLCHISTDFVFDGTKGAPYDEFDVPNPLSVYGRSKWAGEQAVRWTGASVWIVRTQWLYGLHGRNFAYTMLRLASERDCINVVDDQVGAPTYTADLAAVLYTIVTECPCGVYHANNAGEATWYDFARAVLEKAGRDPGIVRPIPTEEYPTPAARPKDSRLDRLSLRMQGKDTARPWQEALDDFINAARAAGKLQELGARE
jgi:dTDP-4-dehydrorhamnose reductase